LDHNLSNITLNVTYKKINETNSSGERNIMTDVHVLSPGYIQTVH